MNRRTRKPAAGTAMRERRPPKAEREDEPGRDPQRNERHCRDRQLHNAARVAWRAIRAENPMFSGALRSPPGRTLCPMLKMMSEVGMGCGSGSTGNSGIKSPARSSGQRSLTRARPVRRRANCRRKTCRSGGPRRRRKRAFAPH